MTPRLRTEWCVCGTAITAVADDWADIEAAVRRHNETPSHQAYRLGLRLVREPLTDTPDGMGVVAVRGRLTFGVDRDREAAREWGKAEAVAR